MRLFGGRTILKYVSPFADTHIVLYIDNDTWQACLHCFHLYLLTWMLNKDRFALYIMTHLKHNKSYVCWELDFVCPVSVQRFQILCQSNWKTVYMAYLHICWTFYSSCIPCFDRAGAEHSSSQHSSQRSSTVSQHVASIQAERNWKNSKNICSSLWWRWVVCGSFGVKRSWITYFNAQNIAFINRISTCQKQIRFCFVAQYS